MDDRAIVARQLGRAPRAFGRVAVRCPYGLPAVTEQLPYDSEGEPFPTTYYLTCPHLVSAVARVEAAGGVERWSVASQEDAELATSLSRATEEQRRVRHELAGTSRGADDGASLDSGIGGSRMPSHLKCLHAHVAYALARPGYELGERMLADVVEPWPTSRCCSELLRGTDYSPRSCPPTSRARASSGKSPTATSRRCRRTLLPRSGFACSSTP